MNNQNLDNKFKFKKKFGQNFIFNDKIIDKIISFANIDENTLVVEVGTGYGKLTTSIASKAKTVLTYEIDIQLKETLSSNFKNYNNILLIIDDFLKRDLANDIKDIDYKKKYFVANLPYYITTPIIKKLISEKVFFEKIIIMVQKELGERMMAEPGIKSYNSLSVYLKYFFEMKILMSVSKEFFVPKPKVESVIMEMVPQKKDYDIKDESLFFNIVRDAFKYKRKNLRNNLKSYDLKNIEEVLRKYNLDLTVRAENISIDQFIEISNELSLK